MKKPFKVFSTFTGIGGFELGIHAAANGRPVQVVGYSEIDKFAISVYENHFKGVKNYGDITKIDAEKLPDFDCIVGGFPCQAFSIAGKRHGFDDTRGTLFFDLARILQAKRPRLFVFENVKGLVNHDNGNTFKTIITTLTDLGYSVQWQVLNSKNHGVPQNRERIIIIGHFGGQPRPQVFPNRGSSSQSIERLNNPRHSTHRVYATTGISPALSTMQGGGRQPYILPVQLTETRTDEAKRIRREHMANGRDFSPRRGKVLVPRKDQIANTVTATQGMERYVLVREATKSGYAKAEPGQSINLNQPNSKTRRGRVSDVAPTLDTHPQVFTLTQDMRIRRLTPLECERLQAFPDNWTQYDRSGNHISDSQRYKMCGNAVTTKVIEAVFTKIFEVV